MSNPDRPDYRLAEHDCCISGSIRLFASAVLLALLSGCGKVETRADASKSSHEKLDRITFNAVIQPILSENCYHCHGPDSSSRKGGLRLDRPEFALKGGESGKPAIVAGDPDKSQLVRRILSKDPQEVMPPPAMHNQLEPHEIDLLKTWIKQGGVYEEHWAFIAPKRPAEPAVKKGDWPKNSVDRFILARLEREGLAPSPAADREALIRRVTYDLTGLPPTPEETAAFLADQSPEAYERVVDRLLASPRYGEHRARYWLDVARYGDSHGLHADTERSVWAYRDYVIRAFNQNKPFDQFTRENLAGDMLPAANLDQQLASAYVRLGVSTGEGGVLAEEVRVNNQRERVEAFGAAYLGLTTGCAACHDHKFDPLSQKDHYRLTAFFNNLTESPLNGEKVDWPPSIKLPAQADLAEYNRLLSQKAAILQQLQQRRDRSQELIGGWLRSGVGPAAPVSSAGLEVRLKFDEQHGAHFKNSASNARTDSYAATGVAPVWGEETWLWPSMRMETTTRIELPGVGDADTRDGFAVAAWVKLRYEKFRKEEVAGTVWSKRASTNDAPGWELYFREEILELGLFGEKSGSAAVIRLLSPLASAKEWNHILATYDGSGRASGLKIYVNGIESKVSIVQDALVGSIRSGAPLTLGSRYPDAAPMRQTTFQDFRVYRRAVDAAEAKKLIYEDYAAEIALRPIQDWTEDELHAAARFYFLERDADSVALAERLPEIERQIADLTKHGVAVMVSEESPLLAYSDVLDRGVYSQRKERVRPAVPHFLPQMPANAPKDRRGLAEWTVSAANPLTARVTVNRMWAELFGTGLVETTEDFGVVGARPSHPELLDWLAVEFRESGWDLKRFYRLLVTSSTYRQSARIEPGLLDKDPKNRLLARGPRFRMDAEMLRDTVLATSGLLVEQLGGPSVKPYQPPGIWEAVAIPDKNTSKYVQDHGEALYRRSLYTFWKRMSPMPNISTLDAPDRDIACTRRQRTNTPLQALVTLNDVQWLEAARHLAERLVRDYSSDQDRIRQLGRLLVGRAWNEREVEIIDQTLVRLRNQYSGAETMAAQLVSAGESIPDARLPVTDVAVWMMVASAAQNLDATLNK